MRSLLLSFFLLLVLLATVFRCTCQEKTPLLTGAFLSDTPTKTDIIEFREQYDLNLSLVLVFVDWNTFIPQTVIQAIDEENVSLVVTWEPWVAHQKQGISPEELLHGNFDDYITKFATEIQSCKKTVYIRFAHEMNGNWYPWSIDKIGARTYQAMYRYLHNRFQELGVRNVRWIFSINHENVPPTNDYKEAYPGDSYVDYIGIDGYNWGNLASWSRWKSFHEIFFPIYRQLTATYDKDIFITEFSSTGSGGDKVRWFYAALSEMMKMKRVRGFILFNVDKEADWKVPPEKGLGKGLNQ